MSLLWSTTTPVGSCGRTRARWSPTKMTTRIIAISPTLIALGAARPASSPSASAEKYYATSCCSSSVDLSRMIDSTPNRPRPTPAAMAAMAAEDSTLDTASTPMFTHRKETTGSRRRCRGKYSSRQRQASRQRNIASCDTVILQSDLVRDHQVGSTCAVVESLLSSRHRGPAHRFRRRSIAESYSPITLLRWSWPGPPYG